MTMPALSKDAYAAAAEAARRALPVLMAKGLPFFAELLAVKARRYRVLAGLDQPAAPEA